MAEGKAHDVDEVHESVPKVCEGLVMKERDEGNVH